MTIVRPSIIESALAEPRPGWIRGFRMAEPIIVSYARGLLREFPGVPEGVTDVIPVDLVVAAIIAVAAEARARPRSTAARACTTWPPASGTPSATGAWSSWSRPGSPSTRSTTPTASPSWYPPGRSRAAGGSSASCPGRPGPWTWPRGWSAPCPSAAARPSWMAALEEQHLLADRALGYVELYGAYTETEARYRVDRLMALWDRTGRRATAPTFCFDPAVVDWDTYVRDIHLPSVIEHARVRTSPGKSEPAQPHRPGPQAILSPDRHLAAFDLENTLIASNVVDSYAWLASRHLPAGERAAFVADLLREAPALLALDRRDRGDFLRTFYRRYEGAPVDRLRRRRMGALLTTCCWPSRSRPASPGSAQHRALGHRTMLITGALDLVVEPLRPLFDDIVCARLGEHDGRFTGRLDELPPIGEARALVLGRLRRRRRPASSRSRWPTPTRPATCPCWRRWASRWPSTPKPSWPPSPGGGDGTSSTGPRPTVVPSPSCPSARSTGGAHGGVARQPGRAGRRDRRSTGGRADEGPGPRAQPAPLRRLPGGLGLRLGPGRRGRTPPTARRRAARAPGRRLVPPPARCSRGSAGRTWPRSTGAAPATSRTW